MIDGNAINELLENAVSGGALPGVGGGGGGAPPGPGGGGGPPSLVGRLTPSVSRADARDPPPPQAGEDNHKQESLMRSPATVFR